MKTVDWSTVNWSLTDSEIARRVGRTRERVRQVRQEMGLPPSRGSFGPQLPLSKWFHARSGQAVDMTARDLAEMFDTRRSNIYQMAGKYNVALKPIGSFYRDNVNWKLPGRVIGEIWGMANPASIKKNLGINTRPSWDLRRHSHRNCTHLKAAILAEKKKIRRLQRR